jgi:hypothetical protein
MTSSGRQNNTYKNYDETQNVKTHNRTTQKIKEISNRNSTKIPGMNSKGEQFLLLRRHPPCNSYIQSSLVNVVAVIEERKNLHKK